MKHALYLMTGLLAVVAGATLAGMTLSPTGAAASVAPTCGTATATATGVVGDIAPFGITTNTPTPTDTSTATATATATPTASNTPLPTCTPVRIVLGQTATVTDTPEPTAAATGTPVPPTAPATATAPGGGAAGRSVQPPDTGSGPSGSSVNWLAISGAALLVLAGTGSLAVAARRRR